MILIDVYLLLSLLLWYSVETKTRQTWIEDNEWTEIKLDSSNRWRDFFFPYAIIHQCIRLCICVMCILWHAVSCVFLKHHRVAYNSFIIPITQPPWQPTLKPITNVRCSMRIPHTDSTNFISKWRFNRSLHQCVRVCVSVSLCKYLYLSKLNLIKYGAV